VWDQCVAVTSPDSSPPASHTHCTQHNTHPQASIADSSAAGTASVSVSVSASQAHEGGGGGSSSRHGGREKPPPMSNEERRLRQRCMSLWSKANNFKVAHHFRRKVGRRGFAL
jgi:hypothetical protein